jgi:hypothetical protein
MNLKQNKPLLSLPSDHPARMFLAAFIDCRASCVGCEIDSPDCNPIEQVWFSQIERKECRFSEFAYKYLSFDIVLDGWLTGAHEMTESELAHLDMLPHLGALLAECKAAAEKSGNEEILPLLSKVGHLLDLWEKSILLRHRNRH